jgi:MarR family transcriptional regulator, organic hydroperoxide resistance regulator
MMLTVSGGGYDSGLEAFLAGFDALTLAVRRARGAQRGLRVSGLTLSQYGLLELLEDRDSARVRELAEHAGVSAPTATRILHTLERRGLVRRSQTPEDRRGVSVTLTARGREALVGQHVWLRDRQRAFYGQLPAAEQQFAPDLLVRLAGLIDALAAGPEGGEPT